MAFDFGALPPEINSTRMYTGPGAAPMMAAAAAYSNLAAELSSTATAAESVISTLTDDEWRGPSAATMATAAAPYVQWLQTTSASMQHAAEQAIASAAAYEAAYAMTVSPAAVAANRAQLAALVATNILGQNTPAIAALEALYGEMWAQDAAAMYGYAGSSALAARLTALTTPTPAAGAGALGAPSAAAAQTAGTSAGLPALVSSMPNAVQSLANPAAAAPASALGDFFSDSLVQNIPNGIIDMASWNGFNAIVTAVLYSHTFDAGLIGSQIPPELGAIGIGPAQMAAGLGSGGASAAPVSAVAAQAATVGKLSVPAAWSAATPAAPAAASLAGSGWAVPAEEGAGVTNVAAGMPAYASAGRGGYGAGPRYGIKPTVMPRQVLV
ncbi:PPE family protein PPE43 [Mycobacterium kiyosense]|uniref:PPE family protein PPE43 n=1 Tax=Mycobacterium kiyosense TaxID=2871094 RepID=A0A9P3Q5N9_9MYCO|nr:PPE family protein [Mycobacterium kiyosense]GLB81310.1 PPE family protein PPE43 [Mycobacterium kiyosense]GLB96115.1 PPE family protein PPE43 [Mycobacterium kiyosense]GLD31476.1 PPE family protein PPE43 [Mycobacterium kiyosense]GLD38562.1 PPE family protein PPE43 [Mycobacterium kiyosense]GLD43385.1 PPE family protein PPE43 [Mycobacterium kiyosense]